MPKVAIVIYGHAANIHPDLSVCDGSKSLYPTSKRVVNSESHGLISLDNTALCPSGTAQVGY